MNARSPVPLQPMQQQYQPHMSQDLGLMPWDQGYTPGAFPSYYPTPAPPIQQNAQALFPAPLDARGLVLAPPVGSSTGKEFYICADVGQETLFDNQEKLPPVPPPGHVYVWELAGWKMSDGTIRPVSQGTFNLLRVSHLLSILTFCLCMCFSHDCRQTREAQHQASLGGSSLDGRYSRS